MSTHPIEHIEPVVGQVGPEQIDAPADAGPQARGEILRLRLALAKAQRRIAELQGVAHGAQLSEKGLDA